MLLGAPLTCDTLEDRGWVTKKGGEMSHAMQRDLS